MVRAFTKKTTNVGGTTGVIIPKAVLYAEGINRGDEVRIIIELVQRAAQTESEAQGSNNPLSRIWTSNFERFAARMAQNAPGEA